MVGTYAKDNFKETIASFALAALDFEPSIRGQFYSSGDVWSCWNQAIRFSGCSGIETVNVDMQQMKLSSLTLVSLNKNGPGLYLSVFVVEYLVHA